MRAPALLSLTCLAVILAAPSAQRVQLPREPLAFVSNAAGAAQVQAIGGDGAGLLTLTGSGEIEASPAWSRDGGRVAFARGRLPEIVVLSLDGMREMVLAPDAAADDHPTWAPDGTRLAFESRRAGGWDIWIAALDGSGVSRLTPDQPSAERAPDWSSDGARLAYATDASGDWEIVTLAADGTDQRAVTASLGVDTNPAWSPNGTHIAFESTRAGSRDIWIAKADGADPANLTPESPSNECWPTWSPDGSRVAFASDREGGEYEVFLVRATGGPATRLTDTPAGSWAWQPAWRPSRR